jgi:CBS domain-containing protein
VDYVLNLNTDTVEQAMSAEPLCVEPHTTIREVFELLQQRRTGSALICRGGVLAGIFTERDALRLMAQGASLDRPIEQVMVANPMALRRSDSVATAIRKMAAGGYRRLPIIDDQGRPVGLVKVSWIVRYLVEHFPHAVYNLPPEPQPLAHEREGA